MDEQTESDEVNRPSPITAALLSQLPPAPQNDSDTDMQVSYGSEDWHSAVPTVCNGHSTQKLSLLVIYSSSSCSIKR